MGRGRSGRAGKGGGRKWEKWEEEERGIPCWVHTQTRYQDVTFASAPNSEESASTSSSLTFDTTIKISPKIRTGNGKKFENYDKWTERGRTGKEFPKFLSGKKTVRLN
jgi:hypothetical protein